MYVAMHFAAAAQVLLWFEVQLLASSRQLLAFTVERTSIDHQEKLKANG
jgi:hypothetical protein